MLYVKGILHTMIIHNDIIGEIILLAVGILLVHLEIACLHNIY